MTTTEITPQLKLTVVKHLASGKTADVVATIVRLPRDRVVDIASNHGYPDPAKLAKAAELIAAKIDRDQDIPAGAPARTPRPSTPVAATSTPAAAGPTTAAPDQSGDTAA